MVKPVNPGPLVMSDAWGDNDKDGIELRALDLVDGATDAPDPGAIAFMLDNRPDWQGYAAWLVRASNNHEALVEALTLVLPMAKGYAHAHRVGSNEAYVEQAESVLAQATGAPEAGEAK